ncbi:MAG: type toxin-antitoxin system HicB family antitoxin [Sphingobacteriaceae bacterium]|jgi:predicted HicB family RNase H-like nuclease|nr:type toxin-antitoxin system HicB family antitoxin [Sphingobacteriaceae bacterium]
MENVLKYDGFVGSVKYNSDDKVFHGKIEFITDLVTFEGQTVAELEAAFTEAVEDYKELCSAVSKDPKKSFSGVFNVRLKPELHQKAALLSIEKGVSLNQLVNEALNTYIVHQ